MGWNACLRPREREREGQRGDAAEERGAAVSAARVHERGAQHHPFEARRAQRLFTGELGRGIARARVGIALIADISTTRRTPAASHAR